MDASTTSHDAAVRSDAGSRSGGTSTGTVMHDAGTTSHDAGGRAVVDASTHVDASINDAAASTGCQPTTCSNALTCFGQLALPCCTPAGSCGCAAAGGACM